VSRSVKARTGASAAAPGTTKVGSGGKDSVRRKTAGGAARTAPRAARKRSGTADAEAAPAIKAPRTLAEFMALALTMEMEAAQRYAEFADAMETHNNREVAELFRKMADIEARHAQQIMAEMHWREPPASPPGRSRWGRSEGPETAPSDTVHYLMQPYHALEIALANEKRAEEFFARLARIATVASIRKAARTLQAEERAHVALVKAWLAKVPKPDADWAEDPDPPRYTD
jgi:rubrerythrin